MGDKSAIEWTDATWNPVRGCSIVSKGCTNCYAMRQAHRHAHPTGAYAGLTKMTRGGPVWTGKVRLVRELLQQPLKWKRPRRIFVNSMSDLFHESVPWEFIDAVFGVMALADRHRFQILTKRPRRMLEYFQGRPSFPASMHAEGRAARRAVEIARARGEKVDAPNWDMWWEWPLRNVWLGVSCEDQAAADERIPLLLETPAAVRWISAEPLLGPLDLRSLLARPPKDGGTWRFVDWVVAGGESGPGARPMHPDWPRALRDVCGELAIAFFFKQWGAWTPYCAPARAAQVVLEGTVLRRAGKKANGRHLDGRTHEEYPA